VFSDLYALNLFDEIEVVKIILSRKATKKETKKYLER